MADMNRIQELQKELKEAADSYYNSGIELMSNKEYDAKFDELRVLEQQAGITDGFTSKVGSSVTGKLSKVTHEYEAKSLGKTKDIDELIAVHQNYPDHAYCCLSWKLDGSTVQLTYKGGDLALAATRGDGHEGQDITKNAKYIEGIPQKIDFRGELVVRGEALMSYEEFDRLNADGQYANPRNLANATITAIDESLLKERHCTFKAFELVSAPEEDLQSLNSFANRLTYLNTLGFGVVTHERVPLNELKAEIALWSKEEAIKALGYPVDGLVIANDDTAFTKNLTGTEHHPHLAKGMAFKWKDETAETVLRDIEWSPSRTGLLNPVAVFDTVDLCGTKVSRASLHNVSYVDALNLKIGDRITVYKANMIIPQIDENLDKDKEGLSLTHGVTCPCCKTKAELQMNFESGTKVMVCPNEACPEKELGRLTHFVSKHGMNIEGLSEKTLKQLMDAGLVKEPADLYELKNDEYSLLVLDGMQMKSMRNLLSAIEKSENPDFSHFMYACGIPNFGRGQIKVLKAYIDSVYGDDMNYLQALTDMYRNEFDFTTIDGIGSVLAGNLEKWIKTELLDETPRRSVNLNVVNTEHISRTNKLLEYLDVSNMQIQPTSKEGLDNAIAGKSFCITGSLESFSNRDACVEFIESKGGKFVSGVSKKTDYLVNNDITSTSGKNKKAKELGIPIITEKQLIEAGEGTPLPDKSKVQQIEKD